MPNLKNLKKGYKFEVFGNEKIEYRGKNKKGRIGRIFADWKNIYKQKKKFILSFLVKFCKKSEK